MERSTKQKESENSEIDMSPILTRLDMLNRLMAYSLLEGKTQNEQLYILSKAGFQPKTIAEMLGTTANTVRVQLSKIRKSRTR
jgi:DNA-binding CsgD family transcriptional regulator